MEISGTLFWRPSQFLLCTRQQMRGLRPGNYQRRMGKPCWKPTSAPKGRNLLSTATGQTPIGSTAWKGGQQHRNVCGTKSHLTLNLMMRPAVHLTLNLGMKPAAHLTLNLQLRGLTPLQRISGP